MDYIVGLQPTWMILLIATISNGTVDGFTSHGSCEMQQPLYGDNMRTIGRWVQPSLENKKTLGVVIIPNMVEHQETCLKPPTMTMIILKI